MKRDNCIHQSYEMAEVTDKKSNCDETLPLKNSGVERYLKPSTEDSIEKAFKMKDYGEVAFMEEFRYCLEMGLHIPDNLYQLILHYRNSISAKLIKTFVTHCYGNNRKSELIVLLEEMGKYCPTEEELIPFIEAKFYCVGLFLLTIKIDSIKYAGICYKNLNSPRLDDFLASIENIITSPKMFSYIKNELNIPINKEYVVSNDIYFDGDDPRHEWLWKMRIQRGNQYMIGYCNDNPYELYELFNYNQHLINDVTLRQQLFNIFICKVDSGGNPEKGEIIESMVSSHKVGFSRETILKAADVETMIVIFKILRYHLPSKFLQELENRKKELLDIKEKTSDESFELIILNEKINYITKHIMKSFANGDYTVGPMSVEIGMIEDVPKNSENLCVITKLRNEVKESTFIAGACAGILVVTLLVTVITDLLPKSK